MNEVIDTYDHTMHARSKWKLEDMRFLAMKIKNGMVKARHADDFIQLKVTDK